MKVGQPNIERSKRDNSKKSEEEEEKDEDECCVCGRENSYLERCERCNDKAHESCLIMCASECSGPWCIECADYHWRPCPSCEAYICDTCELTVEDPSMDPEVEGQCQLC